MDPYRQAHLLVAAIRILEHQKKAPPSIEDVCSLVDVSVESGHAVCRDLKKRGIVETMEDPYTLKLTVADHLALEDIPGQEAEDENSLAKELKKFKAEKKRSDTKMAAIQAGIDKKKKDMLSDIEAKFKKEMEKFNKD